MTTNSHRSSSSVTSRTSLGGRHHTLSFLVFFRVSLHSLHERRTLTFTRRLRHVLLRCTSSHDGRDQERSQAGTSRNRHGRLHGLHHRLHLAHRSELLHWRPRRYGDHRNRCSRHRNHVQLHWQRRWSFYTLFDDLGHLSGSVKLTDGGGLEISLRLCARPGFTIFRRAEQSLFAKCPSIRRPFDGHRPACFQLDLLWHGDWVQYYRCCRHSRFL